MTLAATPRNSPAPISPASRVRTPNRVVHHYTLAFFVDAVEHDVFLRKLLHLAFDLEQLSARSLAIAWSLSAFAPASALSSCRCRYSSSLVAISFMAFGFAGGGGPFNISDLTLPGGGWSEYTMRPLASVHL